PLEGTVAIGEQRSKAWAVHPAAPNLQRAADRFLDKNKRLVAILRGRYFKPSKFARSARSEIYRADRTGRISPFDEYFRAAGETTGIDWRLLAAVAYAESRFDPKAQSRFGARGLMQLLPGTAKRVGETDLFNPRKNVQAGAKYLQRLMKIFAKDGVEPRQQIRFALASYNCGLGHVLDARDLARKTGKNPNRWFGQVEEAMKLKEKPEWHRKTRFGYARSRETIAYVSRIQAQYDVFTRHVPLE
ncbi:MAG: transglycosylase SLT domain-containing protein, partial [Myxococcota bacterium]